MDDGAMKKNSIYLVLLSFISILWAGSLKALSSECLPGKLADNMGHVLPCYLEQKEPDFNWKIIGKDTETVTIDNKKQQVTRYFMNLTSLYWKQGEQGKVDFPLWKHRLTIYQPEKVTKNTALLYINSGVIHPKKKNTEPVYKEVLPFAAIAARTNSVVINLNDVPNQYLRFNKGDPLKEDQLIAYTWYQFMRDPNKNYNWPLRLPMVKSVIAAMNAVQTQLRKEHVSINHFVLSGASKRGWTAWIAAAMDPRVTAVIPLVADFINLPDMIQHLFKVYKKGNPAIAPYMPLMPKLGTESMSKLFSVVDPFQYRKFLTMPKFMVSASGDDFVPADTTQFFFHALPAKKWMRVLPNSSHYIFREDPARVSRTLESFYGAITEGHKLPEFTWEHDKGNLTITSSTKPKTVKLWQASNTVSRDFRKVVSNSDVSSFTPTDLKFNCTSKCKLTVALPQPKKGWAASFVEVSYSNAPYPDLIFTTRLFVTPDRYAN
ncbi:MAG: PhoPQ-activated protein PqaA family protein [Endozoicomonas sp. (ex Botrylloides leachii)]|nr:PhoPQ-activated protein PqaA family protein [Endozoicomonas sp. (ex Botrylloides leachii)]